MILFINTLITDLPIPNRTHDTRDSNRQFVHHYSAFDIFKYSLSSLSKAYNWKKVILKISLSGEFADRKIELTQFIDNEFKDFEVHLFWERNVYQYQWQETYDLLDDELIWLNCNHDHICLDSDTEYLESVVEKMREEQDGLISSYYTHWQESIGYLSQTYSAKNLKIYDDYATMEQQSCDSINIISKKLYKEWWFSKNLGEYRFPRPDWSENMLSYFVQTPNQKQYIQFKENSRHYDAYFHLTMSQCPSLEIPCGFFDKNIKLQIGGDFKKEKDNTWINPLISSYKAENGLGVDYKMLREDIPLFWKDNISSINEEISSQDELIAKRLDSIVNMLYQYTPQGLDYKNPSTPNKPHIFDKEVLDKILNVWKRPYEKSKAANIKFSI